MCELFLICHFFLKLSAASQQLTTHICVCCSSLCRKHFQKKHLWLPKAGKSRSYLWNTKQLFFGFTDRADTPFTVNIKVGINSTSAFLLSLVNNKSSSQSLHVKDSWVDSYNRLFQKYKKTAPCVHPSVCPSITQQSVYSQINTKRNSCLHILRILFL